MARPELRTKFRGTGQSENEVFQDTNGTLKSLYTYGTAGVQNDTDFEPGSLSIHWNGALYSLGVEDGIYKNTPPETSGVLLFSFSSPDTGVNALCSEWHVVFKDGKQQLFTAYRSTTSNSLRFIFIDEEDNVTETANISHGTIAAQFPFVRNLYVDNKLYSTSTASSNFDLLIMDPVAEDITKVDLAALSHPHSDLAVYSGVIYMYAVATDTTVGEGNTLWNISSAVPYKLLEWEAYQASSTFFPSVNGQNCIFNDGEDLILVGYGSGNTTNEIGCWKVNFDANGIPNGLTDIRDVTLGFNLVGDYRDARFYASRDIESELGVIRTKLHVVTEDGQTEGNPIHTYQWNGANTPATYLGVGADSFAFDTPTWKIGGGARTYSNQSELDFIVTDTAPTGVNLDVTYKITGTSAVSGVAMCVKYDNLKDSPLTMATVTPLDKGITSGNYIAGLTAGESGMFRWNVSADNISPGDAPVLSAFLIRIA